MTDFEMFLCCLIIPVAYILTYIAGKHDLLLVIGIMLDEKLNEFSKGGVVLTAYEEQKVRDLINGMTDEEKEIAKEELAKWQQKKDRACVRCENIFTCKGKPEGVTLCLNFKERKKKDGGC